MNEKIECNMTIEEMNLYEDLKLRVFGTNNFVIDEHKLRMFFIVSFRSGRLCEKFLVKNN